MPVAELLARVTSTELTEWAQYERVFGPLGQGRDDIHLALLSALMHNMWAEKGKGKSPEDFMPQWDQKREDIEAKIRRVFGT